MIAGQWQTTDRAGRLSCVEESPGTSVGCPFRPLEDSRDEKKTPEEAWRPTRRPRLGASLGALDQPGRAVTTSTAPRLLRLSSYTAEASLGFPVTCQTMSGACGPPSGLDDELLLPGAGDCSIVEVGHDRPAPVQAVRGDGGARYRQPHADRALRGGAAVLARDRRRIERDGELLVEVPLGGEDPKLEAVTSLQLPGERRGDPEVPGLARREGPPLPAPAGATSRAPPRTASPLDGRTAVKMLPAPNRWAPSVRARPIPARGRGRGR